MTLGEYPDKVSRRWLIPPEAFKSDYEIGRFHDVAAERGVREFGVAGGVILEDFDNDGHLDLMISHMGVRDQLEYFHNDGEGTFTRMTEQAGLKGIVGGLNLVQADYDNDGCIDVFVPRGAWLHDHGQFPNSLLRNNCDGTFTDVTAHSGTASPGWSVSAAFVDIDRDGWLDLFVGHYLNYRVESNVKCFGAAGGPDYCPPHVYAPQPSTLYRNNHDGTFTDVTARAGMAAEFGPALGVATADFNHDGWIDIYVANDGQPNQLWINQQDGTFRNAALLAGAALGAEGEAKSSMGVDAADFDNDGDEDLFITELTGQGVDLYVNNGSGVFEEQSARVGLRLASLPSTGFGAAWFDVDNDGWLDVLTVNGAVTQNVARGAPHKPFALQQRKQLFRNNGHGRFDDVSDRGGAIFQLADVGRGAAFGDIDNDGDIDVIVGNAGGSPQLLVNNVGQHRHWIGLRLVGQQTPRDMIGARVAIVRADGSTLWRRARSDGSYASANDPRVVAGLGDSTKPPTVRVQWPDGRVEEWHEVTIDRYTTLKEGTATSPRSGRSGRL
jgi:hypothetical protein